MTAPDNGTPDAQTLAAITMLGRTGARDFQLRYQDDEAPTVWIAVARYGRGAEAAGALTPKLAVLRLCEQVIDGGECAHCHRPTVFDADAVPGEAIAGEAFCWYQYDPELATYRRACEGDAP